MFDKLIKADKNNNLMLKRINGEYYSFSHNVHKIHGNEYMEVTSIGNKTNKIFINISTMNVEVNNGFTYIACKDNNDKKYGFFVIEANNITEKIFK